MTPRTEWTTPDIWMRKTFVLPGALECAWLRLYHDQDCEVYLDGHMIAETKGYVTAYFDLPICDDALRHLSAGANVIAVHCRQTVGGQGIDVGIVGTLAS